MTKRKPLPTREYVFILSLMYHGFRLTNRRKNLKFRLGYVIPATRREDAGGVDFIIKMPRDDRLFPIQVTQRGVRIYHKYHELPERRLEEYRKESERRVSEKRKRCKRDKVAFVLVRDFDGQITNPKIAWGDIKALRYAIAHLQRWL